MTGINEGRPLFVRTQDASFTLANFMRGQLFTALGALRTGMDILFNKENVKIDRLTGHGGFFKTQEADNRNGLAMHTHFVMKQQERWSMGNGVLVNIVRKGKSLSDYLEQNVFATAKKNIRRSKERPGGFNRFLQTPKGLDIEEPQSK